MKKLKLFLIRKQKNKGQSLMEMTLVLGFLLILALGAVEFGNLLNQYIILVDGTREGARYASNQDPYFDDTTQTDDYTKVQPQFWLQTDAVIDGSLPPHADGNYGAIAPLVLGSADEVMIYFISVRSGPSTVVSEIWCKNGCPGTPGHVGKNFAMINSNPSFIQNSLSSDAPNTGLVVVELFYEYHQLLGLPLFTAFVPDPINVHAYTIMPLSAAEPTPVVKANPSPIAQ